jgi:hypothetical protein
MRDTFCIADFDLASDLYEVEMRYRWTQEGELLAADFVAAYPHNGEDGEVLSLRELAAREAQPGETLAMASQRLHSRAVQVGMQHLRYELERALERAAERSYEAR